MGEKGHAPKIDEPDIGHAFNMEKRVEKFDLGLEDITAHTLKIIEIIEEERNMIKMKNQQKLKQQAEQAK